MSCCHKFVDLPHKNPIHPLLTWFDGDGVQIDKLLDQTAVEWRREMWGSHGKGNGGGNWWQQRWHWQQQYRQKEKQLWRWQWGCKWERKGWNVVVAVIIAFLWSCYWNSEEIGIILIRQQQPNKNHSGGGHPLGNRYILAVALLPNSWGHWWKKGTAQYSHLLFFFLGNYKGRWWSSALLLLNRKDDVKHSN